MKNYILFSLALLFSIQYSFAQTNISWTNITNVTVTGANNNGLLKPSGGNSWNAGASSVEVLPANTAGSIEVTVQETNKHRMIGFSDTDENVNWKTIDFALFMRNNGNVEVRENGSGTIVSSPMAANDVLRIERAVDGTVTYYKNGDLLHTSSNTTTGALIVDASLFHVNGTIHNAVASFGGNGGCSTTVYADTDGDGYGDPNNTDTNCDSPLPTGWVANSDDCDDTDANINPTTVWYQDSDADGFGNSNVSLTQCDQPNGYVLTSNDCDDTNNDPNNNCGGGGGGETSHWTESGDNIYYSNGKVWIGNISLDVSPAEFNLFVEGGIMTERLKVAIEGSGDWADFVFKKGYKLITIEALQEFIKEHGHLPNMPSADEVAMQGIDVAKMNALLLQQIEESKLYIIELNERINQLNQEVQELKQK